MPASSALVGLELAPDGGAVVGVPGGLDAIVGPDADVVVVTEAADGASGVAKLSELPPHPAVTTTSAQAAAAQRRPGWWVNLMPSRSSGIVKD